jgi:Undecaprenyl-phosphate glucose phosphotransferase
VPSRARIAPGAAARGFQLLDIVVLTALASLAASGAAAGSVMEAQVGGVFPFIVGAVTAAWTLRASNAYAYNISEGLQGHLVRVVGAFAAAMLTSLLALSLVGPRESAAAVMLWTSSAALLIGVIHIGAWDLTRTWRRNGRMTPTIVFVGATPTAERLIEGALATREVAILGIFDDRLERAPDSLHGVPVLGDIETMLNHRIMPYVDRVVITVTEAAQPRVRQLVDQLRSLPNEVTLLLDVEGEQSTALSRITDAPLAFVNGRRTDEGRAFDKRLQDILIAVVGLVFFAPLLLLLAVAVKLDSPGPVIFRQRRHGFNNEEITVYKFRSMRVETADAHARRQVTADDERVTRLGRFIRRTSLDELPQLINVLRGEMSIVGPRPHAIGMMTGEQESSKLVCHYAHRHRIKPGITGWAQINGSRGPVHTPEEVCERVALDVEYIERQSLWLDLYIMAMTLPRLMGDRGAVR